MTLSIVMVTENAVDVVEGALQSVRGLWDELLVGDGGSTDGTVEIAERYGGRIQRLDSRLRGNDNKGGLTKKTLGERKQELVERAKGEWILVLDADERVGEELRREIQSVVQRTTASVTRRGSFGRRGRLPQDDIFQVAYRIPYQNYVFGRPVYYGGERYSKVRLFRRGYGRVTPEALHEEVRVIGEIGEFREFRGKIHHHSYRSLGQLFSKFTRYAWIAAGIEIASPRLAGSRNDVFRKLFLYGPHMFWARYVKEQGYRDGWRGLVLAAAFGYMEGLTYWFIFIRHSLAVLQESVLQNHEVSVW